jgi:hypothetical protein
VEVALLALSLEQSDGGQMLTGNGARAKQDDVRQRLPNPSPDTAGQ